MAQTHLPPQWRERVLAVLNAKVNPENLRLLDAWSRAEGGTAQWNPLNSTYGLAGSTNYNDTGVKNYPSPIKGLCATAITFANGLYNGILGDLQGGGKTAEEIVNAHLDQFHTWGTDTDLLLRVMKEV